MIRDKIDFYNTNLKSVQDIEWYLLTWFEKTENNYSITRFDKNYEQILGFKRGMTTHCIFRETNGQSFLFIVGNYESTHKSFGELLNEVSIMYYKLWNN
jgi:hypothetical protein